MIELIPMMDGVTHCNVYTKGRTELGRLLTNFPRIPFRHPILGDFDSSEGLHYFLKLGEENKATGEVKRFEEFRTLYGFEAKQRGVELSRTHMVLNHDFDYHMRLGLIAKITQNSKLFRLFVESSLPLTHYYYYGDPNSDNCKVVSPKRPGRLVTDLEEIREFLRNK
ncbi:hypothetical protein D3C81_401640 [compost metagenome]